MKQIIIESYSEKYGWCLEKIGNEKNAESVKRKLEEENKDKKYRISIVEDKEGIEHLMNLCGLSL